MAQHTAPSHEHGELELHPVPALALRRPPGLPAVFARALWLARGRPQGTVDGPSFPRLAVELDGVRVPARRVGAYRAVCHAPGEEGVLPLAMPEVLFLGLLGRIATHPDFPLSPLGLIHTAQTLTGHAPVRADTPLRLRAEVARAERTPKGVEVELALQVRTAGALVWEARTVLLSRSAAVRARAGHTDAGGTPPPQGVRLPVPEHTGRAYARVSGDANPHHLWAWTARPLGYPRPIAHGMWSLARLLGQVPAHVDPTIGHAAVRFLRPIAMPGEVVTRVEGADGGWTLDAWDPATGAPHVRGSFHPDARAPGPP